MTLTPSILLPALAHHDGGIGAGRARHGLSAPWCAVLARRRPVSGESASAYPARAWPVLAAFPGSCCRSRTSLLQDEQWLFSERMYLPVPAAEQVNVLGPRPERTGCGLSGCVHPVRYRLAGAAAVALNVTDRRFVPY